MGYNGMGYQRWIATMKPRKYLSKRSKPDGGGGEARRSQNIGEFYHIRKRDFSTLGQKEYSESDRKRIRAKMINQKHIQNIGFAIGLLIVVILVALIFHYFNTKLNWF